VLKFQDFAKKQKQKQKMEKKIGLKLFKFLNIAVLLLVFSSFNSAQAASSADYNLDYGSTEFGAHPLSSGAFKIHSGSAPVTTNSLSTDFTLATINLFPQIAVCGNSIIEAGEICDSANFGGQTCADYGFNSGSLTCNACNSVSTAACFNSGGGSGGGGGILPPLPQDEPTPEVSTPPEIPTTPPDEQAPPDVATPIDQPENSPQTPVSQKAVPELSIPTEEKTETEISTDEVPTPVENQQQTSQVETQSDAFSEVQQTERPAAQELSGFVFRVQNLQTTSPLEQIEKLLENKIIDSKPLFSGKFSPNEVFYAEITQENKTISANRIFTDKNGNFVFEPLENLPSGELLIRIKDERGKTIVVQNFNLEARNFEEFTIDEFGADQLPRSDFERINLLPISIFERVLRGRFQSNCEMQVFFQDAEVSEKTVFCDENGFFEVAIPAEFDRENGAIYFIPTNREFSDVKNLTFYFADVVIISESKTRPLMIVFWTVFTIFFTYKFLTFRKKLIRSKTKKLNEIK
jgi:hypothetical protein